MLLVVAYAQVSTAPEKQSMFQEENRNQLLAKYIRPEEGSRNMSKPGK